MLLGDVQVAGVVAGDARGAGRAGRRWQRATVTVAVAGEVARSSNSWALAAAMSPAIVVMTAEHWRTPALAILRIEVVAAVGDVDRAVVGHPEALRVAELGVDGSAVVTAVLLSAGWCRRHGRSSGPHRSAMSIRWIMLLPMSAIHRTSVAPSWLMKIDFGWSRLTVSGSLTVISEMLPLLPQAVGLFGARLAGAGERGDDAAAVDLADDAVLAVGDVHVAVPSRRPRRAARSASRRWRGRRRRCCPAGRCRRRVRYRPRGARGPRCRSGERGGSGRR